MPSLFGLFPSLKQEVSYTFKFQHHKNESFIQTCFLQEGGKGKQGCEFGLGWVFLFNCLEIRQCSNLWCKFSSVVEGFKCRIC